jgi:hypothetical protein
LATAQKAKLSVKKTVTVMEDAVSLLLSKEEAETLRSIFRKIGGSPVNSPRKHADSIDDALQGAGIASMSARIQGGHTNSIYFADYEEEAAKSDAPLEVGERVRIVGGCTQSRHNGETGVIVEIDSYDPNLPYRVKHSEGAHWAKHVERVSD